MTAVPDRTEAAEYYFTYINQVPEGDICGLLDAQGNEVIDLLLGISEQKSLHRYATGKWSIRDVVNHLSDTERLFVCRAFWFARGFESPLPSFDQTIAVSAAHADDHSWRSLVEEFRAVRAATVAFFRSLPAALNPTKVQAHAPRALLSSFLSKPLLGSGRWAVGPNLVHMVRIRAAARNGCPF